MVSYDYPATTVAPTTQTTAAVAEATEEVSTLGHIYVATTKHSQRQQGLHSSSYLSITHTENIKSL